MRSSNLDKLSEEAKALLAVLFADVRFPSGSPVEVIEVSLNGDPVQGLLAGGPDRLHVYGPGGNPRFAADPQWAVVYRAEFPAPEGLLETGRALARAYRASGESQTLAQ